MMKRLLIMALLLMPGVLRAQQQKDSVPATTTHPAYYYYTGIPPFQTTLVNGKSFSDKNLIKGRPVIMFLFLPDCGYCHKEMEWITAAMARLAHVQIVMVTDQSMADMAGYYQEAGLAKYRNIKMGRQENRDLIGFYGLKYYPGIFVYDKNHQIVYHHEGTVPVDTLLHYLKD